MKMVSIAGRVMLGGIVVCLLNNFPVCAEENPTPIPPDLFSTKVETKEKKPDLAGIISELTKTNNSLLQISTALYATGYSSEELHTGLIRFGYSKEEADMIGAQIIQKYLLTGSIPAKQLKNALTQRIQVGSDLMRFSAEYLKGAKHEISRGIGDTDNDRFISVNTAIYNVTLILNKIDSLRQTFIAEGIAEFIFMDIEKNILQSYLERGVKIIRTKTMDVDLRTLTAASLINLIYYSSLGNSALDIQANDNNFHEIINAVEFLLKNTVLVRSIKEGAVLGQINTGLIRVVRYVRKRKYLTIQEKSILLEKISRLFSYVLVSYRERADKDAAYKQDIKTATAQIQNLINSLESQSYHDFAEIMRKNIFP